jgi:hypothetical protein
MASHFDDVYGESGLPGVLDTLGESVLYRAKVEGDELDVVASVGPERQEESMDADREVRRSMRDFTFAAEDIPTPMHDDEIVLGDATYVINQIEHTSTSTVRVRAWRKLSIEKTRRGQRGKF